MQGTQSSGRGGFFLGRVMDPGVIDVNKEKLWELEHRNQKTITSAQYT